MRRVYPETRDAEWRCRATIVSRSDATSRIACPQRLSSAAAIRRRHDLSLGGAGGNNRDRIHRRPLARRAAPAARGNLQHARGGVDLRVADRTSLPESLAHRREAGVAGGRALGLKPPDVPPP